MTYQSVKDDLTSHFQRLLGYFPGTLFLHLTYSYVDEPSSVLSHLKLAAESESPTGFIYKGVIKNLELPIHVPRDLLPNTMGRWVS